MLDHTPTALMVHAHPPRRPPVRCTGARRFAKALPVVALLLFCIALFTPPGAASAEDVPWQAVIAEHPAIPPYLIAVDKSRQELAFFERRSPLRLFRRFACTTGQAVGDKALQGDLKTPEGIYFVVYRIGSGLDFVKYGYEAYTLNYPNPVDRLRKKTGYGIWIHGRGEPLMPLQTEGCISMHNDDLALLSKVLVPGAPVALTGSYVYEPAVSAADEQTYIVLRDKVTAWAKAWSDRSADYFSFYDKEAYSIAQGEPFSAFKVQKERLFKILPWIRTSVRDIQMLRGPDYWVTWFHQDYQAPNLSTRGVRRLYWAKDARGEFKILGMEWHPGLNISTLLASADPLLPPLEQQCPVWPDELPAITGNGADNNLTASRSPQGQSAPVQEPPPSPPASASGTTVAESSRPNATLLVQTSSPEGAPADHAEYPAQGAMARPSPKAVRIGRELNRQSERNDLLETLRRSSETARMAPVKSRGDAHPALALPPALPTQGIRGAVEPPAIATAPSPAPGSSPATTEAGVAALTSLALTGQTPSAAEEPVLAHVAETPPSRRTEPEVPPAGTPTPPDAPAATDHVAIVPAETEQAGADWLGGRPTAPPPPAEDNAPQKTMAASPEFIVAWVEEWRGAWQAGDLDRYMAFYAPKAKQGSRGSAASIRKQKERLWAGAAPSAVELTNVSVSMQGATATAVMRQTYLDSRGKGDFGLKTLTFRNINGVWLITQEDWNPLR